MGHARALLAIDNESQQIQLAQKTADQGLSVRAVEKLVKTLLDPPAKPEPKPVDPEHRGRCRANGGNPRSSGPPPARGKSKGRIEIEYGSQEELDRIYSLLTGDE